MTERCPSEKKSWLKFLVNPWAANCLRYLTVILVSSYSSVLEKQLFWRLQCQGLSSNLCSNRENELLNCFLSFSKQILKWTLHLFLIYFHPPSLHWIVKYGLDHKITVQCSLHGVQGVWRREGKWSTWFNCKSLDIRLPLGAVMQQQLN